MPRYLLALLLVVYVASAAASYGVFAMLGGGATDTSQAPSAETTQEQETALGLLLQIDPSEPKDQACPLNGALYTKTEQAAWAQRRPLAVMIENTPDARPQSGLSSADIVFEAVAEGGVTRFMAMYYCASQIADITLAPIRSARTYFIDWASGFNRPLYVHVGGANIPGPANALGQLGEYGWNLENDLNQFSIGYPTFVRNFNRIPGKEIATEHTMETSTERLWQVGVKRGWTNMSPDMKLGRKVIPAADWATGYTGYKFADDAAVKGTVSTISHEFWSGYSLYSAGWTYDSATNSYKRSTGGEAHLDLNNDQQIAAKNVVVLFTNEKGPIDEAKHMLYTTVGTGNAIIFQNGEAIKAKWAKKDRESELMFTDLKGAGVEFVRGQIWISVVDTSTEVQY